MAQPPQNPNEPRYDTMARAQESRKRTGEPEQPDHADDQSARRERATEGENNTAQERNRLADDVNPDEERRFGIDDDNDEGDKPPAR